MLHGSPGSHADFRALGPVLASHHRVIAPDLPGFGDSTSTVADYSIRAHARDVLDLLDTLAVEKVHLLGFSMGGGVALEIYDQQPQRVASLTLLSAIGVIEFELLGNHRLNHAVHALQLGALWLAVEATPHFGLLDGAMLSLPYARNFFDSDQRPLREILTRVESPTLIVHGRNDMLVPYGAAREHYRLVPQSEFVTLDANHFMVFGADHELVDPIVEFLSRVERGSATIRSSATEARIQAARKAFDPATIPAVTGISLFVVMTLLAAATLVSEDLTCIAAGLIVAQGRIGFLAATLACGLGIFIGDLLLYLAGRYLGRPWLTRRPLSWFLDPGKIETSSEWLRSRGPAIVFITRFLPGSRLPTFFTAGMLNTPFWKFFTYFALAVVVWTPALVGTSALAGARMLGWFEIFERYALLGFCALVLVVWLLVWTVRNLVTRRGRQIALGRLRRWAHWEFWPLWLAYAPVVGRILWFGVRYRSPTLFTAANPGIPLGGFVGESKWDIIQSLPPQRVARTIRLAAGESHDRAVSEIEQFLGEAGLDLPVVLKPDAGERGRGVTVARNWDEVTRALENPPGNLLVQEYVPGVELGVFYYRMPDEPTGRIFSITEKVIPTVLGDGRSSLEQLVLDDSRAVMIAATYLEGLQGRRFAVPEEGERIPLTDLGTHCKGAIFLDGSRFATPELEDAIDRISREFEGFYFGRFDLRAQSEQDLREGRFTVIELNGVTSEATHIYDPAINLTKAYRVLFRQWGLAFEIGRRNRGLGIRPASIAELARAFLVRG